MADISPEISAFQNAVYGEEVRGSMISLAEKLNDVCEDTEDTVDSFTSSINTAISNAESATSGANTAAARANNAATSANTAAGSANTAATNANAANASFTDAETARVTAETARAAAETARASAESSRASAENSRVTAENARAGSEANRASNESTRQESETNRNSAEVARVTAEANRAAAETQRQNQESVRQTAENSRSVAFGQIQAAWADMEQQVLPPATTSTLGGVIVGTGLEVDANGVLTFEGDDYLTVTDAAETYATIETVNGKASASHTHSATDIASGTLPVARGGTGVATAAAERERLGLGSTTDALPVANGGTGATTAANARTALDVYSTGDVDTALAGKAASSHTHAASDIASGQVPIANGGTGASAAAAALTALGAASQDDMDDAEQAIADNAAAIATLGESVSLSLGSNVLTGMLCPGYISASGNYVEIGIPCAPPSSYSNVTFSNLDKVTIWTPTGTLASSTLDTSYSKLLYAGDYSCIVELKFSSTQTANRACTIYLYGLTMTFTR